MDKQVARSLLNQVSVEAYWRQDGRGGVLYHDPVVVPCYVSGEVRMVRNLEGEEVVSSLTIFLSGTNARDCGLTITNKPHNYRVTLPDGRQPGIINVQDHYDSRGELDYVEVYL